MWYIIWLHWHSCGTVSVTNAGHMVTMATSSAKHPQDILKETLMVT